MQGGQPLDYDRSGASAYLRQQVSLSLASDRGQSVESPVVIAVNVGQGPGQGQAWGCDLSYDYVKINAEYTT
jgi:glutamate N-acetyltransferase / amino-acid N-acetyltransferase